LEDWWKGTSISGELSIYPEDGGIRFLRNTGTFVQTLQNNRHASIRPHAFIFRFTLKMNVPGSSRNVDTFLHGVTFRKTLILEVQIIEGTYLSHL
jgi:hypothetical protein